MQDDSVTAVPMLVHVRYGTYLYDTEGPHGEEEFEPLTTHPYHIVSCYIMLYCVYVMLL